jgi:hypothetical protein
LYLIYFLFASLHVFYPKSLREERKGRRRKVGKLGRKEWKPHFGVIERRPGIAPGLLHLGFVVDEVALWLIFLRVIRFSPVDIIPPWLSIFIY